MSVVILDNGGYTAKVGLSYNNNPLSVPNCIMKVKSERRRAFIGQQIESCLDTSGLFYMLCFQKGLLVNWDAQKTIWDHIFSPDCSNIKLSNNNLIITEPIHNLYSIQEVMTEILFEEFECAGILRTTAADMAAYNYGYQLNNFGNCIVIDVGYSSTHIVPFINGKQAKSAVRRIEVGGKVLTNYLKEVISYRYLNMMDETFVVNQIKEDVCFVAQNFVDELTGDSKTDDAHRKNRIEYILPDFTTFKRGFIKKNNSEQSFGQQAIHICNERFTIPELLFNPSDVGISQMGIPEAVIDSLKDCPEYAHSYLLKNVVLVGGCSLFPGFSNRLKNEIEKLAPDHFEIHVTSPKDPIAYSWYGAKQFSVAPNFNESILTKEYYEERGFQYSFSIFD